MPLYTIEPYYDSLVDNETPAELKVVYASYQWTSSSPMWGRGMLEPH